MEECWNCKNIIACYSMNYATLRSDLRDYEYVKSNMLPFLSKYCNLDLEKQKEIIDKAYSMARTACMDINFIATLAAIKNEASESGVFELLSTLQSDMVNVMEDVKDPLEFLVLQNSNVMGMFAMFFANIIVMQLVENWHEYEYESRETLNLIHDCYIAVEDHWTKDMFDDTLKGFVSLVDSDGLTGLINDLDLGKE